MTRQHTGLTFFINGPHQTLLDRFKATLADTQLFDVLVGYFRSSGFYQAYFEEEKKLAIIHREFDRLYDPRHPVRNNLETLDSVEVVRTIREALKR